MIGRALQTLQEPPDGPVATLVSSFTSQPWACVALVAVILGGIALITRAERGGE